jgi:hypothetical protein
MPSLYVKDVIRQRRSYLLLANVCAQPRASSHVGCSALFGSALVLMLLNKLQDRW